MAGIDLGSSGGSGRKSVDSEINMIPMIDLLMVTISFLLLTAVWTHMARIDADAQVPGRSDAEPRRVQPEKQLHVEARSTDKFVLLWKQGATTVDTIDVPRQDVVFREGSVEVVRYPQLASRIESEWKAKGQHTSATDTRLDQAVLHASNGAPFKEVVAMLDAIEHAQRGMQIGNKTRSVPAFNVTFATD
jgi:biopolymer transport protein ExbD